MIDKRIEVKHGIIDNNTVGLTNSYNIIEKYGDNYNKVNHNNYSIELKYKNLGMSFYYKYNDLLEMIFAIKISTEFNSLINYDIEINKDTTIYEIMKEYGFVDYFEHGTGSKEAYISYSGISFGVNASDISRLDIKQIKITSVEVS